MGNFSQHVDFMRFIKLRKFILLSLFSFVLILVNKTSYSQELIDQHYASLPGEWNELQTNLENLGKKILRVDKDLRSKAEAFWQDFRENADCDKQRKEMLVKLVLEYSHKKSFDLDKVEEHDLNKAFYIISLCERGRKFLGEFLPLYVSEKVGIYAIEKEEQGVEDKLPISSYYNAGEVHLILDKALSGLLWDIVHEGTHAIDLSGKIDDFTLHSMLLFCVMYGDALNSIFEESESLLDEETAIAIVNVFYALFPNWSLEVDVSQNNQARLQRFKTDFYYVYEITSFRMLETEHKAYRAQYVFIKNLSDSIKGLEINMRVEDYKTGELYDIDKEFFRLVMTDRVYKIPVSYFDEYFRLHDWEEFN